MMKWLRLYNDTPNDPKWRVVAVRTGQPVGNVLAVWMQMLACASAATERGTLEDWDDETVAAMLGYAPAVVTAIRDAMQGLVLDGDKLTGWDKRQRGGDDAAERKRKERERKKNTPPDGGGSGHGTDPRPNGAVTGQNGNVTRHSEEVTRQPAHVTRQSGTVTRPPLLSESSVTRNLPESKAAGDAGARDPAENQQTDLVAYTVGHRVAEMAGLDPRRCGIGRAEAWLAQGYDPDRDIFPAVRQVMDRHNGQKIHSLKYFDQAIADQRKARTAPMPEGAVSNVHKLNHRNRQQRADRGITTLVKSEMRRSPENADDGADGGGWGGNDPDPWNMATAR
jgi:hypothetical protein